MPLCQFCAEDRKLVRAHAIPEAFFRTLKADGETPLLISNSENTYPKRAPIGVYDQGILCEECEKLFSAVDSYGAMVLLTLFDDYFVPLNHAGSDVAFLSASIDQEFLLRFFVATLWRASVSTHPFYSRVCLGPHESSAKAAVKSSTSSLSSFAVVLSRWANTQQKELSTYAILDPHPERWSGVNAYRMYFGRIVAYIKVDNRSFPYPYNELALTKLPHAIILSREFRDSRDFAAAVAVVKSSSRSR